jgi:RNA polymerase sigma-70 factor (ECF subfamily)
MDELSDKEILELFNDEESRHYAFNLLVRQYQRPLYSYVRRMLIDHDDTKDVLQNVFIKAWKGLPNFRNDSRLFSWLYRIAYNETQNFIKKQRRNIFQRDTDTLGKYEAAVSGEQHFTGDEIQKRLQMAVSRLPDKQRAVFVFKYFHELKFQEIASITGTSIGALKSSYHIAVKKIEEWVTTDQTF